ncbi:hypothetical protein ACPFUV_002973 [Vibrio cholerae]
MQLQVGKTYQSHRPAETIDLDGEIIQFQGETFPSLCYQNQMKSPQ